MSSIDPTETFLLEAQELLEQLEQTFLDLEHAPDDSDLIDTAFRALHTVKGSGAMFGFEALAAFTHHVETAFDLVRKGKMAPSRALIALGLRAKDKMRQMIEQPDSNAGPEGEAILHELQIIVDQPAHPSSVAYQAPVATRSDSTTWRIRFYLAKDAMAMGTNPLLLLDELRSLGECSVVAMTDRVPAIEELDPTACYVGWNVVLATDQSRDMIEQVFMFVIDDMELTIEPLTDGNAEIKRLGEILVDRGDATAEAVETALAPQSPVGELLVKAGAVASERVAAALSEQQHLRNETRSAKVADSIRVPATRLDELMDRVGELVIAQSRLKQVSAICGDAQVKSVAEELERLVTELRDTTMGIRTVPIGSLFGRFRHLVHDLAQELNKQITLITVGEETELDKTVVERLNDPLVHILRNSIDHGLETAEARVAAGKSPGGTVTLSARHVGAEVLITIKDDGRGLDRDRIRARAEEQGLLAPGAQIADNELFQILFQPGFSTAREVTSLSGRGVGMDVVKRNIEALRGTIDLVSTSGEGTETTLRLPLTLAIIDGLLVRVGGNRYVIPLGAVEECVELTPEEDSRSRGRSFLNIRNNLVPFLRLRELFNASTQPDRYQKVVIVSAGDLRVGLVVDQVIGDHQTVIKSLSKLHAHVETFSGATILGDGTVALILDIAHLVEFGQTHDERLKAAS